MFVLLEELNNVKIIKKELHWPVWLLVFVIVLVFQIRGSNFVESGHNPVTGAFYVENN